MNVLVVDIGGTHVKILATGQDEPRKFPSGPTLTPERWSPGSRSSPGDGSTTRCRSATRAWCSTAGRSPNRTTSARAGSGSTIEAAFGRPVKIINDAAMQALGSYKGGTMLFLGLGTGLGSALIVDGIVEPMELGHLPYKKGTYEDYVGLRGLEKHGKKKWRQHVADVVARLIAALEPDDVVLGRRQRQEAEGAASGLPGGRQRQRVPRRLSAVGGNEANRKARTSKERH